MFETAQNELSGFLSGLAESLDISEAQYQEAKKHYEAVGNLLSKEGSTLAPFAPEVYPQGSFVLGTVVKPISDTDKYDIDLVCELTTLSKDRLTQKHLKEIVGNQIMLDGVYGPMLQKREGRRCWTLEYADATKFHMDILPSIPDGERQVAVLDLAGHRNVGWAESALAITDRLLPNYDKVDEDWPLTNPKGYAGWFRDAMEHQFTTVRMTLADASGASIEEVPEHRIKTTLQRTIQILKRHRDIMFDDDKDDKPISIIISTLAARSYANEADLLRSLRNVVSKMPSLVDQIDGLYWVANPVNPMENFADKWKEHPQRARKFFTWLKAVHADLESAMGKADLASMVEGLKPRFGDRIVNEVTSKLSGGRPAAAVAASITVPHIVITNPSKPYGSRY